MKALHAHRDENGLYTRRWQALVVLAMSLLVVSVDNTILNVALPTIREELDASSSQLQWIVDSYLLVFAGLLLAAGSLGDRFGRKRSLMAGLCVFGAGSLLAAISGSSNELIASRALMGVGAAAIMPTTLSILTNIFPEDERPRAIAIWAAVAGIGIAIGPISGGFLIEHFAWSSVFLVNLPVVAGGLIAGAILIPESRDPESPRLDLPGFGLSIAGPDRDRLGPDRGAGEGLDQHDDHGRLPGRRGDPRAVHRLGAAHRSPDARDLGVPQHEVQRGQHRDHVRVLRADGRHVLPHHLPAVGAGLQRPGGRGADGSDRPRADPGRAALGDAHLAARHEDRGGRRPRSRDLRPRRVHGSDRRHRVLVEGRRSAHHDGRRHGPRHGPRHGGDHGIASQGEGRASAPR